MITVRAKAVRPMASVMGSSLRMTRNQRNPPCRGSAWNWSSCMFVALFIRRPGEFAQRLLEREAVLGGVAAEEGDFLKVTGIASLKTRNCFTASA